MKGKAKQVNILRLNPSVPVSPMCYVEGGWVGGEVDYF